MLEFNEWNEGKIAVIHMKTSPHYVPRALDSVGVPYIEFEHFDPELYEKIQSDPKIIGIIIGGAKLEKGEVLPELPGNVLEFNKPKMGICLGHEILGVHLGANLVDCNGGFKTGVGEFSEVEVKIYPDLIYDGLDTPSEQMAKMEHYYMLDKVPPGSKLIASTHLTPVAGFHHYGKEIWGFQFHPEKDWMRTIILKNFYKYCSK